MNSNIASQIEARMTMIESKEDLVAAVVEAGRLLQEISDFVAKNPKLEKSAQVRFPRGFIRSAEHFRNQFSFVDDKILKKNISYALMTHDVFRWIVTRTDIVGQAEDMIIKEGICLIGYVCESISIYPGAYGLGRGNSFSRRIEQLVSIKILSDDDRKELKWLWEKRNQHHLIDNKFAEFDHYTMNDWVRSLAAYRNLRDKLRDWRATQAKKLDRKMVEGDS
jgi:hypothetical protein